MGKLLQRRRRGAVEHAPRQQSGEQIDGGRDRKFGPNWGDANAGRGTASQLGADIQDRKDEEDLGRDRCVATREVEYRYEGNCCERIGRPDQLGRVPREHERGGERDDQDAAAEVRLVPVRVWTLENTTANSAVMPAATPVKANRTRLALAGYRGRTRREDP